MERSQDGFTLIEILVVIAIIASLVGLVTLVLPTVTEDSNKVECMNNLRQIGALLTKKQTSGERITSHSGAAFLLQVAPDTKNGDLDVFICPGENPPPDRPETGTDDFIGMYRANEKNLAALDESALGKMCSYAGPNWSEFPPNPASRESRLWACDACQGRMPHHVGIVTLWESSKVTFIDIGDLDGQDEESIHVGPGSGDARLATMVFHPGRK